MCVSGISGTRALKRWILLCFVSGIDGTRALTRWILLCFDAGLFPNESDFVTGDLSLEHLLSPSVHVLSSIGTHVYLNKLKALRHLNWAAIFMVESNPTGSFYGFNWQRSGILLNLTGDLNFELFFVFINRLGVLTTRAV